ncbi:MAG: MogA/MoaB family molybdenum cofactor biosynthesis protein [Syntrophorhabdaceae bacterium]|nr:MogA/MoaB family molybdenum cofactor biosynthesis protein [Syntrophorhabdales bacterium]MBP9561078.1 MogA/MoaB family molybdenum cofactor biosynthesis protein [Syntrophorhabdaceae bacterium]
MRYRAAVITISDRGSRGERIDTSGPALVSMLKDSYEMVRTEVIPDEVDIIAETIKRLVDEEKVDLIVTTGGTGVGKRDVTPEATRLVIEKDLPGFSEIMRLESYRITPHGIISRGISGIRGVSIIINLPGSPRAATECLSFVFGAIPHALSKVKGDPSECAR